MYQSKDFKVIYYNISQRDNVKVTPIDIVKCYLETGLLLISIMGTLEAIIGGIINY